MGFFIGVIMMVSLKDTAKADDISLAEYIRINRKKKLRQADNMDQFKCQLCPMGSKASDQHILCILPRCIAKQNINK